MRPDYRSSLCLPSRPSDQIDQAILLLLFSKGQTGRYNEPVRGKTRLSKLLFLISKNIKLSYLLDEKIFRVGTYGAHSMEVENTVNKLFNHKMIEITQSNSSRISLTSSGISTARDYFNKLHRTEKNELFMLKFDYNLMHITELIQYVYLLSPEYSRSVMVEKEIFDG